MILELRRLIYRPSCDIFDCKCLQNRNSRAVNYEWAEEIPKTCPPQTAVACVEGSYFRIVFSDPVSEISLHSERKKRKPDDVYWQRYKNRCECSKWSCSMRTSVTEQLKAQCRNFRRSQGAWIAQINLTHEDGMMLVIGTHVDWWRTKSFKIENSVTIQYDLC